ncbi:hypothetical protein [uncultured Rothia sp.]|uniref:hypothetical protein n=1 Tax=uncultured Rothia sp. TaxID=316088 RepID=UPI00321670F8
MIRLPLVCSRARTRQTHRSQAIHAASQALPIPAGFFFLARSENLPSSSQLAARCARLPKYLYE